jgi:2-methylisocitrate lyase-like PEP mutase family enzyme
VGRRLGEGARVAGLQGAGDDQLRLRVHHGPRGRQGRAGGRRGAHRGGRRGHRRPARGRPRERPRPTPANAAEAIALAGTAGAVGGSIEDYDPDDDRIYDLDHAVERFAAAAKMAAALPFDFTLTARAEQLLHGSDDLDGTIARLRRSRRPAPTSSSPPGCAASTRCARSAPRSRSPVNVLGHRGFASVGELFEAGAQRVSVGGALTWVAVAALTQAAEALRDGDLSVLAASAPKELLD